MSDIRKVGRREFLKVTAGSGAGLWLAVHLPSRADAAGPAALEPDAYLRVEPSGAVTVFLAKSEMGQGTYTGMAVLVAEELEADWKQVRVVQADADAKRYGQMSTGGSRSVRGLFDPLRKTGATAREMLVAAAARRWGVDRSTCRAQAGAVIHAPTGRRLGYGALAAAAAREEIPKDPPLKDPKDWRLIGTKVPRLDTPDKTRGRTRFGMDVRVPGLRFAAVARPPVVGGKVARYDGAKARAVAGVRRIVEVPSGVAVVADSTWAAFQGRDALAIEFEPGPNGGLDSAALEKLLADAPVEKPARSEGDLEKALAAAARRLEATYELPLLAHATMEPMNCTAHVRADSAELWAPTQAPTWAQSEVAKALGLEPDRVKVHVTFLGGGFGRRAIPDFAVEAALVAKAAKEPVQVVWTREDDTRHDLYRPAGRNELRGGLDASGRLVAWHHRVRSPSIGKQLFGAASRSGGHPDVLEGAIGFPYAAGAVTVEAAMPELGLRLGWWRSVYASQNAFPEECFLDELAAAAGKDPLAFRLEHLPPASRLRGALQLAAEKAGWGTQLPAGRGRGIACHTSFGSHVAEVAEVSVQGGKLRVHRVVAGVDLGVALNPDSVEHQVEGAIVYALSAVLRGEITLAKGAVVQGNFDDYEPLRIDEMPAVEVHVVPSHEPPGGIGEPGVPPLAPAVANALFAATGKRIRRLPIRGI
ncbi:MAG TPA: xanthine dehydrogenase family protein molybdopterin-binding subunit [Anaeromyxobacter sp.]|nr:xanthine dehydrogenase family protein molybdopterin-binding subunit [Anaeromyxobacter sp.]